jgi:hypothetical protein
MIFGYEYQWNSNTKINGIYIQKQLKFMSTNQWNSFKKLTEIHAHKSMKLIYQVQWNPCIKNQWKSYTQIMKFIYQDQWNANAKINEILMHKSMKLVYIQCILILLNFILDFHLFSHNNVIDFRIKISLILIY